MEDYRTDGLHVIERRGPGRDRPLVLLLHGVIDQCRSFLPVIERLPDYDIVTFDRRGYGTSDLPATGPCSLAGHADDVLTVLGERRATIVGHSMGGNVAMVVAHRRADLVAAAAGFEVHAPWLDCWDPEVQKVVMASGDADGLVLGEETFRRVFGAAAWDGLDAEGQRRRREEGLAYQADLVTGWQTEFAFTTSPVPCLMGNGERSQGHFVRSSRCLAEVLPARYMEITGAKHAAHITHPDGFAGFVRAAVDAGGRH